MSASSLGRTRLARAMIVWLAIFAAIVALLRADVRSQALANDYIQFWSASSILLEGKNPYDAKLQAEFNRAAGWDTERDGLGRFEFLPYYYPPWLALALTPLVPLGYSLAKAVWLALLILCTLATAWLMRREVPRVSPSQVMTLVCTYAVWWHAWGVGQTSPLIVLSIAVLWRAAEARHDRLAGWALAWMSIKPQLTICLLVAALIWLVRERRFRILEGWLTGMAVLIAASTLVYPPWPSAMLRAVAETPLVTLENPSLGTTWTAMLRNVGLDGVSLAVAYSLVAVPVLAAIVWFALRRGTRLCDLIAICCAAGFLVGPYARYYDLALLIFPTLWLLGHLSSAKTRTAVSALFLLTPIVLLAINPDDGAIAVVSSPWFWTLTVLTGGFVWIARRADPSLLPQPMTP